MESNERISFKSYFSPSPSRFIVPAGFPFSKIKNNKYKNLRARTGDSGHARHTTGNPGSLCVARDITLVNIENI